MSLYENYKSIGENCLSGTWLCWYAHCCRFCKESRGDLTSMQTEQKLRCIVLVLILLVKWETKQFRTCINTCMA